ncbi:EamA family transporter [Vermiphilus pyriformis]|nr:MAG: EamA family transporter [Vermiphilus pyriformis]
MLIPLLLNAFVASTYTFAKAAMVYVCPIFMTGSRMLLGGIILLFALSWYDNKRLIVPKKAWLSLGLLAFFNVFLTNALQFWALNYVSSGKAAFIYNMSPFFSALLSYFLLNERMNLYKWAGLIIGFIGFLPLILYPSAAVQTTAAVQAPYSLLPEIALIFGSLSSVIGWIFMKKILQNTNCSAIALNGWSMILGSSALFLTSLVLEKPQGALVTNGEQFLLYLGLLTFINNIVSYNGFSLLLKRYSTTLLFFVGFTLPLFATFYGWLFLGETIGWQFYVAVIMVLSGLIIFYHGETRGEKAALKSLSDIK